MRTTIAKIALLAALLGSNVAAAEALYRAKVDQRNPNGKDLVIEFEELKRNPKTSLVKTIYKSGASVPSAMFIVRGMYEIARERGSRYFIKLKEWKSDDGASMMLVGFCDDKNVDPTTYFSLSEKLPASDENAFLSVANYDILFRPR